MRPHYEHSSRENATPSSGTSLLASCKGVPPSPPPRVLCAFRIQKASQGRRFGNPQHRTELTVNLKQPYKSQLFSVHL